MCMHRFAACNLTPLFIVAAPFCLDACARVCRYGDDYCGISDSTFALTLDLGSGTSTTIEVGNIIT
jgi:hypothetical protein